MLALATLSFLSGVFFGSRFAVLILVPANLAAAALIIAAAIAFGDGLFPVKTAMLIAAIGLQAGYFCGLGLVHILVSSRRAESVAVVDGLKPTA